MIRLLETSLRRLRSEGAQIVGRLMASMGIPQTRVIRAIAFHGETCWVAQCLEHDIAAQANSEDGLRAELARVILDHIEVSESMGLKPFEHVPPAPPRFFKMYDEGVAHDPRRAETFDVTRDHASTHLELAYA